MNKSGILIRIVPVCCWQGHFLWPCPGKSRWTSATQVKPILNDTHLLSWRGEKKCRGIQPAFMKKKPWLPQPIIQGPFRPLVPGDAGRQRIYQPAKKHKRSRNCGCHMEQTSPKARRKSNYLSDWVDQGAAWGNHWPMNHLKTHRGSRKHP